LFSCKDSGLTGRGGGRIDGGWGERGSRGQLMVTTSGWGSKRERKRELVNNIVHEDETRITNNKNREVVACGDK